MIDSRGSITDWRARFTHNRVAARREEEGRYLPDQDAPAPAANDKRYLPGDDGRTLRRDVAGSEAEIEQPAADDPRYLPL